MIDLAEKIRAIRNEKRLTQKEIAEKLGVTTNGYQKIENSDDIGFSRLQQIADVFKMSVVEIINYPNGSAAVDSEETRLLANKRKLTINMIKSRYESAINFILILYTLVKKNDITYTQLNDFFREFEENLYKKQVELHGEENIYKPKYEESLDSKFLEILMLLNDSRKEVDNLD